MLAMPFFLPLRSVVLGERLVGYWISRGCLVELVVSCLINAVVPVKRLKSAISYMQEKN